MATSVIPVTIADGHFFRKTFYVSERTNLKKLLERYSDYLCSDCTEAGVLEFWYETTKIANGQTAQLLGMETGDVIDIRLSQQCTRGACPVQAQQTSPNIHYLRAPRLNASSPIRERLLEPAHPERISMTLKEINGYELGLCVKMDTPFERIMQAFGPQICVEVRLCRFLLEGQRINGDDTPESLEMEEGDRVGVFYEVRGGRQLIED